MSVTQEPFHEDALSGMKQCLSILHLEDNPADREIISYTLRAAGLEFHIDAVKTGEQFAAKLSTGIFDLILCDELMPLYSGHQALLLARQFCPQVPVIIVTGATDQRRMEKNVRLGAVAHVSKNELHLLPEIIAQVTNLQKGPNSN